MKEGDGGGGLTCDSVSVVGFREGTHSCSSVCSNLHSVALSWHQSIQDDPGGIACDFTTKQVVSSVDPVLDGVSCDDAITLLF